jgi:hypothetical protein
VTADINTPAPETPQAASSTRAASREHPESETTPIPRADFAAAQKALLVAMRTVCTDEQIAKIILLRLRDTLGYVDSRPSGEPAP